MQNGDEALSCIILASRCLLVKMLTTIYFDHILLTYTFFEIGSANDKQKKKLNIVHAWIRATVHQDVGLKESLLGHSTTMYGKLH